jgi:hypothetical protein
MTLFERNTNVFIIRIWCEAREIEGATPEWRGIIEHVPTGQRRYFKDPTEILDFLLPYLQEMGYKPGFCWQLQRWLKQWSSK